MNDKIIIFIIIFFIVVGTGIALFFGLKGKSKPSYEWITSDDPSGECSVPCGGGFKYLKVFCAASNDPSVPIEDSFCTGQKPVSKIPCNTDPCSWQVGEWGACSQTCGYDGTQTRTVTCPFPSCQGTMPPTTQSCPNTFCDWTTDDWAPEDCAPCGSSTQTRHVFCPRAPANCDPSKQPIDSQSCTSPNTCVWETSGTSYPYPPFSIDILNGMVSGKTPFKLLVRNNQVNGINSVGSPNSATVDSVANSTTYTFENDPFGGAYTLYPPLFATKSGNTYTLSPNGNSTQARVMFNYDSTLGDIVSQVFDSGSIQYGTLAISGNNVIFQVQSSVPSMFAPIM